MNKSKPACRHCLTWTQNARLCLTTHDSLFLSLNMFSFFIHLFLSFFRYVVVYLFISFFLNFFISCVACLSIFPYFFMQISAAFFIPLLFLMVLFLVY